MHDIKIGTLVYAYKATELIPQLIPHGFETFSLTFWEKTKGIDFKELAQQVNGKLNGTDCKISSLSVFGDALADNEMAQEVKDGWHKLIDAAADFGTDLVTGFTGRVTDNSVKDSIPKFKEVFTEIADHAKEKNVKIAFENCQMGGDWYYGTWNLAFNVRAWEMMFEALDYNNVGLQWEPCHHLVQLTDPIAQLRKWTDKIFNVHGKDATVAWDVIKEHGIASDQQYAWHRTPGFGDSNWTDIISILRMNGYKGSIDIEGYHDPVYKDDLEFTGQVRSLNYLKECRGGEYIDIHI